MILYHDLLNGDSREYATAHFGILITEKGVRFYDYRKKKNVKYAILRVTVVCKCMAAWFFNIYTLVTCNILHFYQ